MLSANPPAGTVVILALQWMNVANAERQYSWSWQLLFRAGVVDADGNLRVGPETHPGWMRIDQNAIPIRETVAVCLGIWLVMSLLGGILGWVAGPGFGGTLQPWITSCRLS